MNSKHLPGYNFRQKIVEEMLNAFYMHIVICLFLTTFIEEHWAFLYQNLYANIICNKALFYLQCLVLNQCHNIIISIHFRCEQKFVVGFFCTIEHVFIFSKASLVELVKQELAFTPRNSVSAFLWQ